MLAPFFLLRILGCSLYDNDVLEDGLTLDCILLIPLYSREPNIANILVEPLVGILQ